MIHRWMNAVVSTGVLLLWGCTTPGVEGGPAAGKVSATWSPAMEALRLTLIQNLRQSGIAAVRNKDDQLQFNLPSDFAFDSDSADIKANMRDDLDQLATGLNNPAVLHMRLLIVGYTDNQGSDAVNDPLSLARAYSVAKYIQSRGVNPDRIKVEGRGEKQPMVSNDQSFGRSLNRRVEIVLTEPMTATSVGSPK